MVQPFSSPEPTILLACGRDRELGPDFLSMRRAFVSYSRPIRFDGKSVNRGLSQSSRSLPQARRIMGSGDENDLEVFVTWYDLTVIFP